MRTKKNIGVAQEVADDEAKKVRSVETLTRHIYGLCNHTTNYALQNEFFAKFYLKAFPEKLSKYIVDGWFDDTYCEEWIGRFMKGTPTIYMDGVRLKAYFEVAIDWNGSKLQLSEVKTPILLYWNGKSFDRHILNPVLPSIADKEDEQYFITGQYDGKLERKTKHECKYVPDLTEEEVRV